MSAEELKLTGKQEAFVNFYLGVANYNATKAAKLAGYSGNDNALGVIGFGLLRNAKIQKLIKQRLDTLAMPASEVLQRLSRHARASLLDCLTDEGEFSIKDAKRRGVDDLVKKLKVKKRKIPQPDGEPPIIEYDYEYEIHDPQAALIQLGRHHKLFTDKVEHSTKSELEWAQESLEFHRRVNGKDSEHPEPMTDCQIFEHVIKIFFPAITAEQLQIKEEVSVGSKGDEGTEPTFRLIEFEVTENGR